MTTLISYSHHLKPVFSQTVKQLKAMSMGQRGFLHQNTDFQTSILRFGNDSPSPTEKGGQDLTPLLKAASELKQLLEPLQAEPGVIEALVKQLLGGGGRIGELLKTGITAFQQNLPKTRKLEIHRDPNTQALKSIDITSGNVTTSLKKRLNIFSSESMSFQDYLKHPSVLGGEKKLLLAVSGFTIPPCKYLMNNPTLNEVMMAMETDEERLAFSEQFYVEAVKDYLNDVFQKLKADHPKIAEDIAFVYGVSKKGVDRAVEEFCAENRIKLIGVTCFDWARDIPDEANKPPVYLVQNPFAFRQIFLEESDQLIVMGGRHYAAPTKESLKSVTHSRNPVMPVDILAMQGVKVPPIVLSEADRSTYAVENAAALLKASDETNPAFYPEVTEGMNADNDTFEVFALTQILKRRLERFEVIKKVIKK
jgi:hypothetical protein